MPGTHATRALPLLLLGMVAEPQVQPLMHEVQSSILIPAVAEGFLDQVLLIFQLYTIT